MLTRPPRHSNSSARCEHSASQACLFSVGDSRRTISRTLAIISPWRSVNQRRTSARFPLASRFDFVMFVCCSCCCKVRRCLNGQSEWSGLQPERAREALGVIPSVRWACSPPIEIEKAFRLKNCAVPEGTRYFFHFTQGFRPGLSSFAPVGLNFARSVPRCQSQSESSHRLLRPRPNAIPPMGLDLAQTLYRPNSKSSALEISVMTSETETAHNALAATDPLFRNV